MTIVSKIIKFLLKLLQTKYIYKYTFIEQTMINCIFQNMNICLWNKLQIIVNYGRLIFFIFLIINNIFEYCFQNEKEIYTKYIYDYTFIEKTKINFILQNRNICLWNKQYIIVNYGQLIFFNISQNKKDIIISQKNSINNYRFIHIFQNNCKLQIIDP